MCSFYIYCVGCLHTEMAELIIVTESVCLQALKYLLFSPAEKKFVDPYNNLHSNPRAALTVVRTTAGWNCQV